MAEDHTAGIQALETALAELEREASAIRGAINILCRQAGLPIRYAETAHAPMTAPTLSSIRPDTFYGKRMSSAAKEYLEMRKTAGLGPAKPREVFEALRDGGYTFEGKDEHTNMVSIRATLRKNSYLFHKLPNGQYGLMAWYPNAKTQKQDDDEEDRSAAKPAAKSAASTHRKGERKAAAPSPNKAGKKRGGDPTSAAPIASFIMNALGDSTEWTLDRLKEHAATAPPEGVDGSSIGRTLHGALLSLHKRGLITKGPGGGWLRGKGEKPAAGVEREPTPAAASVH